MTPGEVRRARRALGLTQRELAEELGVSLDTVKSAETERRDLPKPAAKLLAYLVADKMPGGGDLPGE